MPQSNCKPVCKFISTDHNRRVHALHLDIKAARANIASTKRLIERNNPAELNKLGLVNMEIEMMQIIGYLNRCDEILKKW